jgi:hypothetical protein
MMAGSLQISDGLNTVDITRAGFQSEVFKWKNLKFFY